MRKICATLLIVFSLIACSSPKKENKESWQPLKTVQLEGVSPMGIAEISNTLWISDGVGNRIVSIAENNDSIRILDSFNRPMHIATDGKYLFVPEFNANQVKITSGVDRSIIPVSDSLAGPSGVAVFENQMAVSYFKGNQVLFTEDGENWVHIGENATKNNALNQPTDVQITKDTIWVADGYNNRVQVYNKKGELLNTIGEKENMNVSMGLFVSEKELFVTDFENDRVLVYNHQGDLLQELSKDIKSPSDAYLRNENLYILNYLASSLTIYEYKTTAEEE